MLSLAEENPFWPVSVTRVLGLFLFGGVLLSVLGLPLLGQWLIREDSVRPANAIAVLTGHFPDRAIEAAELYRNGYAPEVWLTHPAHSNLAGTGEDVRNFTTLRALGVPSKAIHILDTPVVNTADELNAIDSGLRARGESSVIIVTNKAHTRRVASLWDKYHLGDGEILLHAVSDDEFSPSRWWKEPSSRAEALHEILGMLNVWLGMPVHRPLPSDSSTFLSRLPS